MAEVIRPPPARQAPPPSGADRGPCASWPRQRLEASLPRCAWRENALPGVLPLDLSPERAEIFRA
jgi:hypothetical protein